MKVIVAAVFAGALFGAGLCLSGMTRPSKVQGFLDVAGAWDPGLAFVVVGAIGVYAPLRFFVRSRRKEPVLAYVFQDGNDGALDRDLLVGAALFGVGWGLAGYCPGPSLVALGNSFVFVAAMIGGMAIFRMVKPNAGNECG